MAVTEYNIAFRYSSDNIEGDVFDSEAENQTVLFAVSIYNLPTSVKVNGKTLRGREYQHILHSSERYDITITPDQLPNSVLNFLKDWWNSNNMYICLFVESGIIYDDEEAVYVNVVSEAKDFPLSYIDGNIYLPTINLKLNKVEPNE